jgi:hypothetical protein
MTIRKRLQYRYGSMMNLYSCSREKAGKTCILLENEVALIFRNIVTVQYLHSHAQKSIKNCLRQWDFCLLAHVFVRSAQ